MDDKITEEKFGGGGGEENIHAVSKYYPKEYLLIAKGKNIFMTKESVRHLLNQIIQFSVINNMIN